MSKAGGGRTSQPKSKTWIIALLLVLAIYIFWILPMQMGPRQVKVEYQPAANTK